MWMRLSLEGWPGVGVSQSLDSKSDNCICVGSAFVSNTHPRSLSGKPRLELSIVGKRENESTMEENSSSLSSRILLGILQAYDGARCNGSWRCLSSAPASVLKLE